MSDPRSAPPSSGLRPSADPSDGPAARAGLEVQEYNRRVWDMALNMVHPAALYALCQIVGLMLLDAHPAFSEPGSGWLLELALFTAGFVGAWAVFYSTLLRDAGLASLTVTVLVPLGIVGLLLVWLAFPDAKTMTNAQLTAAAATLTGPGIVGWFVTLRRWFKAKRECADLLGAAPPGGGEAG